MTDVKEAQSTENIGAQDSVTQNVPKKDKKKVVKKDVKVTKEDLKEKKASKQLAKIKGEISKRREEEERLRREAEEEEKRLEEARRLKEEQEAKERELREKKKQKAKERKLKLKEEGKLLTEKQKEDRRKVLEMMHSRGIGAPGDAEKKRPLYGKLKKRPTQTVTEPSDTQNHTELKSAVKEDSVDDDASNWEALALAQVDDGPESSDSEKLNNEQSEEEEEQVQETAEPQPRQEDLLTEEDRINLIDSARIKIQEKHAKCEANRSEQDLRAGVICVLGHVDTGKTKILDKLRNTNVQDREAGGITQQIGATNVPRENVLLATSMCKYFPANDLRVPGLLIIDTPGHESFTNLRVRGSSLCDLAILVVDLMHSLEEQTKESIRILRSRKTPFIVALNKIDRLYGWKSNPNVDVRTTLDQQDMMTKNDFNDRFKKVVQDFALLELNVKLFYDPDSTDDFVSMIPTSAHTGDGMGDLLAALCMHLQGKLSKRLAFSEEFQGSVMEVKELPGLGTTIDVIIVQGRLYEGDTIVLAGQDGPFSTQIRGLLQPAPMSELRVKSPYQHLKEIKGAQGVKVIAKDLEKALAGLPLYVASGLGEELYFKEEVSRGLKEALKAISVSPLGVYVVASTLGSLESLLVYLKSISIPCSGINIGTVHKKDVMKASVMVERDPKWAVILAFDVKVDKDAQKLATELNVRIFTSDIIYRLQTQMEEYVEDLKKGNRRKHRDMAVYPCKLRILPDLVFNKRAPIVMGVHVEAGVLRENTPICVPSRGFVNLGRVFSIESNHKQVQEARTGQEVCVRIDPLDSEPPKLYGRHFDHTDLLVSKISRPSIDVMKEYFRSDLTKEDWKLMVELKKLLDIF